MNIWAITTGAECTSMLLFTQALLCVLLCVLLHVLLRVLLCVLCVLCVFFCVFSVCSSVCSLSSVCSSVCSLSSVCVLHEARCQLSILKGFLLHYSGQRHTLQIMNILFTWGMSSLLLCSVDLPKGRACRCLYQRTYNPIKKMCLFHLHLLKVFVLHKSPLLNRASRQQAVNTFSLWSLVCDLEKTQTHFYLIDSIMQKQ